MISGEGCLEALLLHRTRRGVGWQPWSPRPSWTPLLGARRALAESGPPCLASLRRSSLYPPPSFPPSVGFNQKACGGGGRARVCCRPPNHSAPLLLPVGAVVEGDQYDATP